MPRIGTLGKLGHEPRRKPAATRPSPPPSAGDAQAEQAAEPRCSGPTRYQSTVHLVQNTFAGLSAGSILVLLALGLSIIFGLMGVINMAHGEFMMVGAFTTYVVSEGFKHLPPACVRLLPDRGRPGGVPRRGHRRVALSKWLVIRHLYGRPLETLLATWGVGLILIQAVREPVRRQPLRHPAAAGWKAASSLPRTCRCR